jgi:hypothetical protein
MKLQQIHRALILVLLATPTGLIAGDVLKFHLNDSRDGKYSDSSLTQAAVLTTHRDSSFSAPLIGPIYAQPLYASNGAAGRAMSIVVTEQNEVVALDATNGSQIWTILSGIQLPGPSNGVGTSTRSG